MQPVGDSDSASRREGSHPADPGCTAGAIIGCRCPAGAGNGNRSPQGAIPPLLAKGSSLSHRVCPLLPSPCLDLHPRPLLLPSSLLRVSGLTRPSRFPRECPDHPQDVFIVKMRPKLGPVCVSACFLTGFLSTLHPLYSGNIRRGVSF